MSANYWSSSQRLHWKFTRDELHKKRSDIVHFENKLFNGGENSSILTNNTRYDLNLRIYIHNLILKLGRKLCLRQIILATAEVFIARFLTQVSIKEINIYVLVTTAVYIACKIEEYPQHIRNMLNESRNLWPEYIPNDLTKIAEFEFYLIEELNSYLIVLHPYQALLQIVNIFNGTGSGSGIGIGTGTVTGGAAGDVPGTGQQAAVAVAPGAATSTAKSTELALSSEDVQICWSIINDSYITDIPLLYPPHITAVMAVYLCITLKHGQCNGLGAGSGASSGAGHTDSKLKDTTTGGITDPSNTGKTTTTSTSNTSSSTKLDALAKFLAISNIDLEQVIESTQEMLTLYEIWDSGSYDEHYIKKNLHQLLMALSRSGL